MLKTIRTMNTLLSIRLNLHENLPDHMKNWSISSGRATFTSPSEFELDVSIADEEPSSQFFFIDIRFLFTPAPDLPDGPLRSSIEGAANDSLIRSGLSGCYDFLRDFVLTHKIHVLRRQALEMSKGAWADFIRVESVHRSLVVQYWVENLGGKSWVEIGIASGRPKHSKSSWRDVPMPRIAVKWHRNGTEVTELALSSDGTNLSMERTLKEIIALHINHLLGTIREQLQSFSRDKSPLEITLDASDTEPADCALRVRLKSSTHIATITVNPITGRLALQPSTPASDYCEREVNRLERPALEAHVGIAVYLCVDRQQNIERAAERCGWKHLKNLNLKLDHIKTAFGGEISRYSVFRAQGWESSNWVVAVSVGSGGESWWAVHLYVSPTVVFCRQSFRFQLLVKNRLIGLHRDDPCVGESIKAAIPLRTTAAGANQADLSPAFLHKVERLAMAEISFSTIADDMKRLKVPHSLQREPCTPQQTRTGQSLELGVTVPTLYIRFSSLIKAGGTVRPSKQWAVEMLRLTHHGFERSQGKAVHLVKGVLTQPKNLTEVMMTAHDDDVAFHKSGCFSILLRTSFGTSCLSQLVARLRAIERTRSFAEILRDQKLKCEKISLARIVFSYAEELTADIGFAEGAPMSVTFAPENPHRRVRAMLRQILNNRADGFEKFTKALEFSLPLLQTFDHLERNDPSPAVSSPVVHPRSVDWYRMTYRNPPCSFEIRLRLRKEQLEWHIERNKKPSPPQERFEEVLKDFFQDQGRGWIGIVSTIVAEIDGVQVAITKLDELVRRFAIVEEAAASTAVKVEEPEVVVLD